MRSEATHGCPHGVDQQILRLEVGNHLLGSKNALAFPISIRMSQHAEMDDATVALRQNCYIYVWLQIHTRVGAEPSSWLHSYG